MLRRIFGAQTEEVTGGIRLYIEEFIICTHHRILLGWLKQDE